MKEGMEVRIRYGSTDCTGRIFFPKYFEFFDDATLEFFRERGIGSDSLGRILLNNKTIEEILVVGECQCRFLSETFFDDILDVKLEIERLTEKKLCFVLLAIIKLKGKFVQRGILPSFVLTHKLKNRQKFHTK